MPSTDTKRKPRKPKKNQSLELLRAVTKSMAHAIPGVSDETKDVVDDSLARTVSGMASQVMGEEPETGELVFPPWHNIKRAWNADDRRKRGLPPQKRATPGLIADTLAIPELGGMVGMPVPEFASEASEQAGRMHSGADESMGLEAPVGFRQNAFSSLGTMLGQAPVPGKAKVDAARQLGGGALQMAKRFGRKALGAPVEFFSPTVQPSVANYGRGALFGGALGAAAENPEPIARFINALDQPLPEDPRIPSSARRRLPDLDYEDLPELTQRAKGGKVGALKQMLKAVNLNPDSTSKKPVPYQIGDPVEEVLYAVNEGQRRGVLSGPEAKQIKQLMEMGEDEALSEALLDLHQRLQPKAAPAGPLQATPPLLAPKNPRDAPLDPYGKLTQEEFDQILKRGQ